MTPGDWIALLGVAVALLAILLPIVVTAMLRRADRQKAEHQQELKDKQAVIDRNQVVIDKQTEIIERQRESIIDYKIAQRELGGTAESVRRILAALPVAPRDGSET